MVFAAAPLLWGCRTEGLPRHPQPLPSLPRQAGTTHLSRLERPDQLPPGPLVGAHLGDFRLENELFAVVVAGIGRPRGGALLDGFLRKGGADGLGSVAPVLGRRRLVTPSFERLEMEELGGAVTLRLSGADPVQPAVAVIHEYTVHPRSPYLRITTTLKNRGETVVLQYRVGDRIEWGAALPFAPGIGRNPRGTPSLAWIAGWSDGASYAYYRRGSAMAGALDGSVSTVVLDTLELQPGKQVEVQRLLAVGGGGHLGDLLPHILEAQGVTGGRLDLTAYNENGDPLPAATLEVALSGKPFTVGRTGADGTASLTLPAGDYRVRAHTADRTSPAAAVGIRADRVSPLGLRSGAASRLVYEVRDEKDAGGFPVKLTLTGVDGTPTPWLGLPCSDRPANTLLSRDGKGLLPLPPGRYRVDASHGPEYTVRSETLELQPNGGASFVARLRRVTSTPGYLGIDTTQRTLHSPGCCVSPASRALSNVVEGVDGAVAADLGPGASGEALGLVTLPGRSLRSPHLGWVTLFPVSAGVDPADLLARPTSDLVVQLDGARRPGSGIFTRLEYDPDKPHDVVPAVANALRILDGRHPEDFDQLLDDWLSQLRIGRRLVATGGSGSRALHGGEAGYPRTYVAVPRLLPPDQLAAQIVTSLRQGKAVVSSGPFLMLTINGAGPGETVTLPRRRRPREVEAELTVSAPEWIGLDSLTLYVNGQPWQDPIPIPGRADGDRLKQRVRLPVTGDGFVVAVLRGSSPMSPVVNPTGAPLPAIAVTNPVWIEVR